MKLELGIIPVKDIQFGPESKVDVGNCMCAYDIDFI